MEEILNTIRKEVKSVYESTQRKQFEDFFRNQMEILRESLINDINELKQSFEFTFDEKFNRVKEELQEEFDKKINNLSDDLRYEIGNLTKKINNLSDDLRHEINNIKYKSAIAQVQLQPATIAEALSPAAVFGKSREVNSIYEE